MWSRLVFKGMNLNSCCYMSFIFGHLNIVARDVDEKENMINNRLFNIIFSFSTDVYYF